MSKDKNPARTDKVKIFRRQARSFPSNLTARVFDSPPKLETRVRASDAGHSGQICLCVEASLLPSHLWRLLARGEALASCVIVEAGMVKSVRMRRPENNKGHRPEGT